MRVPYFTLNPGTLLVKIRFDALWNDHLPTLYTERALEERDDAPNRDHDENRDNPEEHGGETLVCFLTAYAPEIFDEPPEENDDGEGDKKTDRTVQEPGEHRKNTLDVLRLRKRDCR